MENEKENEMKFGVFNFAFNLLDFPFFFKERINIEMELKLICYYIHSCPRIFPQTTPEKLMFFRCFPDLVFLFLAGVSSPFFSLLFLGCHVNGNIGNVFFENLVIQMLDEIHPETENMHYFTV